MLAVWARTLIVAVARVEELEYGSHSSCLSAVKLPSAFWVAVVILPGRIRRLLQKL
jgi:hypothetical protein